MIVHLMEGIVQGTVSLELWSLNDFNAPWTSLNLMCIAVKATKYHCNFVNEIFALSIKAEMGFHGFRITE